MKKLLIICTILIFNLRISAQNPIFEEHSPRFSESNPSVFHSTEQKLSKGLTVYELEDRKEKQFQKSFQRFVKRVKWRVRHKKVSEKVLKSVFQFVKRKFLHHFDMKAQLADAFNNKSYNCATGSILLGLVFDELGIRYEIKERPMHVYLVAYIDDVAYRVESTKKRGVEPLYSPFKEHYQGYEKTITFQSLIGNLYYNASCIAYRQSNFDRSQQLLNTAKSLYPNRDNFKMTYDTSDLIYLIKGLEIRPKDAADDIIYTLNSAAKNLRNSTWKASQYMNVYRFFIRHIEETKHPELIRLLEKNNYLNLAMGAFQKNQCDLALNYIEKVYELYPNDNNIQIMIYRFVEEKVSTSDVRHRNRVERNLIARFPCLKNLGS